MPLHDDDDRHIATHKALLYIHRDDDVEFHTENNQMTITISLKREVRTTNEMADSDRSPIHLLDNCDSKKRQRRRRRMMMIEEKEDEEYEEEDDGGEGGWG